MAWSDVKARWSSSWSGLQSQAMTAYEATIREKPAAFRDKVAAFMGMLAQSRTNLARIRAHLAEAPDTTLSARASALEARYATLAAGIYADAKPSPDEVGVAPAVVGGVVVMGLLISVSGVAWSMAAYEYAANLRDHTGLLEKELEARVAASKEGRQLQPSSIPAPPSPAKEARNAGMWVLGGLMAVAALAAAPVFLNKAGG